MNDHFYITLPSDSSMAYYPDNTIARFVTKLPERIHIEGEYEVGLAEIIYPHTWYNVNNDDEKYWVASTKQRLVLQSGYYKDGWEIAAALNATIGVKFSFNEVSGKFSLSTHAADFNISDELQRYLGLDMQRIVISSESVSMQSQLPFDVNRGLNILYIYCNIASHTIVGDTKTPLLRACNVTGNQGEIVRHTYIQPHYVPVGCREFDSIEIAINNELGQPMPFEYGKSVVTLHFRRKKPWILQ